MECTRALDQAKRVGRLNEGRAISESVSVLQALCAAGPLSESASVLQALCVTRLPELEAGWELLASFHCLGGETCLAVSRDGVEWESLNRGGPVVGHRGAEGGPRSAVAVLLVGLSVTREA